MRTQAIILKKIPIGEHDELIICYTKDAGKQVYQAKSILRRTSKQASQLDILNFVDFSLVRGKNHQIITSAYVLNVFAKLKASLPAMTVAYFLLESFDKLIFEGEPDSRLWDFLCSKLQELDQSSNGGYDHISAINLLRDDLLTTLGYDASHSIEDLASAQFKSLQFAKKVLR